MANTNEISEDIKIKSYFHKTSTDTLKFTTLGKILERSARKWPDREAVVSLQESVILTFHELKEKADEMASALMELGIHRGDRVGLWSPNSWIWLVTSMAASRAGFILVPINPLYQRIELEMCINKVGIKALIAHGLPNYYEIIKGLAPELEQCPVGELKSERLPSLSLVLVNSEHDYPGVFTYKSLVAKATQKSIKLITEQQDDLQPDHPYNIQFTSGTTGDPKATVLSHFNTVNVAYQIGVHQAYEYGIEKILVQLPFFHVSAFSFAAIAGLIYGATLVLPSLRYSPKATYDAIHTEKCTVVHGTPTMFVDMLTLVEKEGKDRLSSLRSLGIGGAPCTPHLLKRLESELNIQKAMVGYGLTETAAGCSASVIGEDPELAHSTLGQILDHLEVKVVDMQGKIVPLGTPGELCIRGFSVMLQYWEDEQKTKEVLGVDGWLKTGDQVQLLPNGYLKIFARIKEMIIRGGENVYPKEMEDIINTHENVLEAHVFGIPHERLGEEVCVAVRLKEGATFTLEDIRNYCQGKIALFKVPQKLMVLNEFPKTAAGKVQKYKLAELAMQQK